MKAKDSTDGPSTLGLPMREFSEAWFAACLRPLSAWQEWNRVVGGQWEQWLQLLARTPTPWLPALAENRSDQPPAIEFFLPWLQVEAEAVSKAPVSVDKPRADAGTAAARKPAAAKP
ncbi:hypothetical protein, partial [Pseudothauera lacus]